MDFLLHLFFIFVSYGTHSRPEAKLMMMHLIYVTQESSYENDFTLSDMRLQRAIILDVIGAFTESQLSCSAAWPCYRHKAFFLI